jgi:hypothetical protein
MVFFLQRRIQPRQHCVSKLWSYFGSENPSRVSKENIDKKDLDKRVRALTTLTKDDEIPTLTADLFDSAHPLPAVCALSFINFSFVCLLIFCCCFPDIFSTYSCAGPPVFSFLSSSSRGRTYLG